MTPVVALEATGLDRCCAWPRGAWGTGLVPASVAAASTAPVRALRLVPAVRSRIELAWRAGGPPSPAGRALVAVGREQVARAVRR